MSGYSNIHPIQSFAAGADTLPYGCAVKLDTSATTEPTVILAEAAGDDVVGFVFNEVYHKDHTVGVMVQEGNRVEAIAAGTIAVGDRVAVTTRGHVVTGTGATVGVAMTSAAANEYVTIMFDKKAA